MERRSERRDRRKQHTFVTHERRKGPWDRRKIAEQLFGSSRDKQNSGNKDGLVNMYKYNDSVPSLPLYLNPRLLFFVLFLFFIFGLAFAYLRI